MKLLIVGIDGGDRRVFERFRMPFFESLLNENRSLQISEDLFSRGWAEMLTGQHGRETKGFYMYPKADGTHAFSLSYSLKEMTQNTSEPLLWDLIESRGFRAGIMNVPTTYPAPAVQGFFVSGAGGGLTKVSAIPPEMVSGEFVTEVLRKHNYMVDLRLIPSGIDHLAYLFQLLEAMMLNRTRAFVELCLKHRTDVSFIAFRAPVVVTYLAMSEILFEHRGSNATWQALLAHFFELFDEILRTLFTELSPDRFVLTADHGSAGQKFHVNYNVLLESAGWLHRQRTLRSLYRYGMTTSKNFLRAATRRPIGAWPSSGQIDWSETRVFGHWYYNGIYVNDEQRFGGPVSVRDIAPLVDDVCASLNASAEFSKYGFHATPHRRIYESAKYNTLLPDIWIDAPDEYFFYNGWNRFVTENPWYGEIRGLRDLPSSMYTGTKGRHPILCIDPQTDALVLDQDERDLTLVYKLVNRTLEGG